MIVTTSNTQQGVEEILKAFAGGRVFSVRAVDDTGRVLQEDMPITLPEEGAVWWTVGSMRNSIHIAATPVSISISVTPDTWENKTTIETHGIPGGGEVRIRSYSPADHAFETFIFTVR